MTSNEIKELRENVANLTGYLTSALSGLTHSIECYNNKIDEIFLDHIEQIRRGNDDAVKDLEHKTEEALAECVNHHFKKLKESIASDPEAVNVIKRILPEGCQNV
jgi:hypothetical protein